MKKKDVNHLNRSELIDLVYQMDKSNTGLNTSVSEQIKQERRKIRQKKAIQKFILNSSLAHEGCFESINNHYMI